jgi:large conductance mechanosensitive channel
MLSGFRSFLARGNVVDLAVAVVIGAAFGAVVKSLVADLITPLIGALFGKPDFGALAFTINNSRFAYGDFINALIAFVLVAAAVYFFVIVPLTRLGILHAPAPAPDTKSCPFCIETIPALATRCKFCCSEVVVTAV